MLLSVLGLGLLMGMQHAFEADHLAAVSSLVSRKRSVRNISWHGAVWGIGHTLTLLVVAGTCLAMRTALDQRLVSQLELVVGVMLVLLGLHVLWRLWRDRVHIGVHEHVDGMRHLHAHSHRGDDAEHAHSAHEHEHPERWPWRTLLVGTMHGMAGSAALVVLAASSNSSPFWGLLYVLLFGLGSVVGMALLSTVIALPLCWTARSLTVGNRALQATIGVVTVVIGFSIIGQTAPALFTTA